MIRVLHIDAGKVYGGVETLLLTFARSRHVCAEMEPQFGVCFEGRLSTELRQAGVPVHFLGEVRARNPLSVLRARRSLARLLARESIDVVLCHMPWVQAIFGPVARKFNVALIFWLHSASDGKHWVERWARRTPPDIAVAPSRFTAATVSNIYADVPVEVVHHAIPAPTGISQDDRLAVRLACDTAQDAVVIVQAGRLAPFKGYEDHVRALARLRDDPSWVSWIVGGPQRAGEDEFLAGLTAMASELGISSRVKFLGQRSDVARVLAAADIYCQPNTGTEGLPVIFGEAMHAGLPVVSSAIGGFEELIDSTCGILVQPANPDALSGALRHLIRDQQARKSMGSSGRKKIVEFSDPGSQLTKLYELASAARARAGYVRSTPPKRASASIRP